jgi:hypothetical protein
MAVWFPQEYTVSLLLLLIDIIRFYRGATATTYLLATAVVCEKSDVVEKSVSVSHRARLNSYRNLYYSWCCDCCCFRA